MVGNFEVLNHWDILLGLVIAIANSEIIKMYVNMITNNNFFTGSPDEGEDLPKCGQALPTAEHISCIFLDNK